MAEKIINTRILNKYDSYTNWTTNNPVLKKGEIAIAAIENNADGIQNAPSIVVKVGDGTNHYKDLKFVSAIAADVHEWAKAADKPEYKASEITGLSDYISGEIQDTNTEYSFSLTDNYKVKVQKKDVNGEYADYQVIDLTSAFATKADKVTNATAGNFAGLDAEGNLTDSGKKAADFATAAQGALADSALQKADITSGSANGTIAVEGTDVAVKGLGSAAFTDAGAYAAKAATEEHIANGDIHVTAEKKAAWDTAATKAGANEAAINAIKNGVNIDSFMDVEDALTLKVSTSQITSDVIKDSSKVMSSGGVYTALLDYVLKDSFTAAMGDALDASSAAQTDVDNLEKYVGTFTPVGEETTVVGYIDAKIGAIPAQTDYSVTVTEGSAEGYAKVYTFSQLGKDVATINIPKDMVVESGSVVTDPEGQPAGTYIKLVLANATEDELFINVGDLIEYVTGGTAADGMITVSVDANHVATATINDGTVTLAKLHVDVQTAIGKAHEHANKALLDTYTQTEANLADAVAKKHAHENADVLAGITAAKVADWDDAVTKEHEHSNKTVLDGITAEKVAAWDAAQPNVLENIAGVEGSIANKTFTVTGVSTDLLKNGTDTLIFDCGTSAI